MTSRDEIVRRLDELLHPESFSDYGPNGLQVHGAEEVTRIALAVSATGETIERAAAAGAQLLLVHHGLIWGRGLATIGPLEGARLRLLLEARINLVAYHLPLDAHETLGNNAILAGLLGLARHEPFASFGRFGELNEPTPLAELTSRIADAVSPRPAEPLVLRGRTGSVRRIAIVSGGGGRMVEAAASAGCDLLVTGEPEVDTLDLARELRVDVICAGHVATETFGVRALGHELEHSFPGLETEYLEVSNPV